MGLASVLVVVATVGGGLQSARAGGGPGPWPVASQQYVPQQQGVPQTAGCYGPGCSGTAGADIDPFCGCNIPRHPCFNAKPTNGYDNQRYQWLRVWADHKRLPQPYLGDSWLDRYENGRLIAPAGTIASPYRY
jgi:hypothetical protein